MSVGLYMDVHVHRAITDGLRLRGVDVLTAQEDGRRRVPDDILLDRLTELQRVLFSQDEDLLAEADHRQKEGNPFAGVVYAHQLRVTIGVCVRDLELMSKGWRRRATDPIIRGNDGRTLAGDQRSADRGRRPSAR